MLKIAINNYVLWAVLIYLGLIHSSTTKTWASPITCKSYLSDLSTSREGLPLNFDDLDTPPPGPEFDELRRYLKLLFGADSDFAVLSEFRIRTELLPNPSTALISAQALILASQSANPHVANAATSRIKNETSLRTLSEKISNEQDPASKLKLLEAKKLMEKFLVSSIEMDHRLWGIEQDLKKTIEERPEWREKIEAILLLFRSTDDSEFVSLVEARELFLAIKSPLREGGMTINDPRIGQTKLLVNPEMSAPLFGLNVGNEFTIKARLWATVRLKTIQLYASDGNHSAIARLNDYRSRMINLSLHALEPAFKDFRPDRSGGNASETLRVPSDEESERVSRITGKIYNLNLHKDASLKVLATSLHWRPVYETTEHWDITPGKYLMQCHRFIASKDTDEAARLYMYFEWLLDFHLL